MVIEVGKFICWSFYVFIVLGIGLEVNGLARVDNRAVFRRPNATTSASGNQWQPPVWNASYTGNQWGRLGLNTTTGQGFAPSFNRTQPFSGQHPQAAGWATTARTTNPSWNRNASNYYPQNPANWQTRPNTTYNSNPNAPGRFNNSIGWGSSGFGQQQQGSWKSPQQYPGTIGSQNSNRNFNNTQNRPTPIPSATGNNNFGWGSSGFGHGLSNNTGQYARPQITNNTGGWHANSGWGAPSFVPGQSFPQSTQPQQNGGWAGGPAPNTSFVSGGVPLAPVGGSTAGVGFNGGWAGGPSAPNTSFGSGGVPLAPVGGSTAGVGFNAGWAGGPSAPNTSFGTGGVPLAPIGGGGGTAGSSTQWNAGGTASLSYPGGQQKPSNTNTNPYSNLLIL